MLLARSGLIGRESALSNSSRLYRLSMFNDFLVPSKSTVMLTKFLINVGSKEFNGMDYFFCSA